MQYLLDRNRNAGYCHFVINRKQNWSKSLHKNRNVILETFASFPSSKIVSTTVAAACDENFVKIIILPYQCNQIFPFHMQKLQLINASQSVCYILKALHQIGTPSALLNPFECAPHSSLNFTRRVNNVSTFSLHLHFDNHSQPWEENLSTS